MQSLEPANDELDYIQLGFAGDLTDFEEEIEVELCDGEGEAETPAVQTQVVEPSSLEDQSSDYITEQLREEAPKQPVCIFQRLKQLHQEELVKSDTPFELCDGLRTTFNHLGPQLRCPKEESQGQPERESQGSQADDSFRLSSLLLDKLVQKEQFNMVIITLNPVNKGYGLFINTTDGTVFQETRHPYSQDLLLDYIDHEELPPPFITYWEQTFPQLFYSGCVIAQIKDFRHGTQPHVRHVLLKPHTQSLINDVNSISMEASRNLSLDEKISLESALVNTVQGPLCLDPSPLAGLRRFQSHRLKHLIHPLRNTVRKQSQVVLTRKRKMEQTVVRCNKHLAEFIANKKHTRASINRSSAASLVSHIQNKEPDNNSGILVGVDVLKDVDSLSRPIDRPPESSECTPQLVEQYILETERPPNTTYHIKLSILQRPSNCEYLGHLYVDKEYKEGETNGASCKFSLGTRARANNYIKQFTEIFTEEGRKSVRITHLVPGQPARVTCTAGMVEREAAKSSSNLRIHNHPKQKILQVLSGKPPQQLKVQKTQKEALSGVNLTLNGLLSSFTSATSSSNQSNGNMLNGELPATPVSSPTSPQVSKTSLMANPAISALANSFRNSVQQYQQQAAAAAAANTIASSPSNIIHPLSGSPTTVSSGVASTNTVNNTSSTSNTAILTLLNSSGSTNNQALNQLLSQPQQQKIVARKMTITNLINSRLRPTLPNSSANSNAVRVPLSTLASQLTSPPQNQTINISSSSINSPIQPTISVQTLSSNTVRPLKQGSVQTLSNIQTLTGSLPSASGVQSLGNVQTIHRLSGTKETGSVSSGGQSVPTSSLGLSMPGLSALLADNFTNLEVDCNQENEERTTLEESFSMEELIDAIKRNHESIPGKIKDTTQCTPSAEDPSPADRLNNSSQGTNLNLASLQASMASIPGLQNVQVSIPGLAVPISVSLNVSTPHIVTASSLPSATMVSSNDSFCGPSTTATVVITNSQSDQLLTTAVKSLPNQQNIKQACSTVNSSKSSVQSIQLVGVPTFKLSGNKGTGADFNTPQQHAQKETPNSVKIEDMLECSNVDGTQDVGLSSQQQFQCSAKQSHLQFQQCLPQVQSSALAIKHRRRSSAADPKQ